jgi:hypothetical protein
MKALGTRFITLGIALMLFVSPVLAQDAPNGSDTDQSQQLQGQSQDQTSPAADDTNSATPVSTPAPADAAAVIAQWGAAPSIGPDADSALAQRWFREQNTMRSRWGVPTAMRDPYLDWQAQNLLLAHLGEPQLPQPPGVTPPAAIRTSQTDQGILTETQFWTISDDLWQAWLDSIESQPPAGWSDERPGEPWFTEDNYLQLFKMQQVPRFDRFRLLGVAGRVDSSGSPPTSLPTGHQRQLDGLAPGSVAAYEPVVYADNLVAVVGYDAWINPDGSLRP